MKAVAVVPLHQRIWILAIDLLIWAVAVVTGVALEAFVVVYLMRIPVSRIAHGGEPHVWLAQFLQPLVTLPILTLALRRRGESWMDLGLKKPDHWARFYRDIAMTLAALLIAGFAIKHFIIAPLRLQSTGGASFSGIRGNVPAFLAALAYATFGVGLNEELQFRGFIQSSLKTAFGNGRCSTIAAIGISGLIFGLAHAALGPANVVYAVLGGMLLGVLYLWADRNLWVVIVVHGVFDVLRLIQFFMTGNDLPM